jgi:cell division protein FtsI (penicillin-binding protein 3)
VVSDSLKNSLHLNAVGIQKGKVPNVKGMSAKDAIYLLESNGLSVRLTGCGRVVTQSILPGTEIHKGQVVKIELK